MKKSLVQQAYDRLEPEKWANTGIAERLKLLRQVQENLKRYGDELALAETKVKNARTGAEIYGPGYAKASTAALEGGAVAASIQLYESLAKGKVPSPIRTKKINDGMYDVQVFPQTAKDKIVFGGLRGHLRIRDLPRQVNPLTLPPGVIAILGMGNFNSSLERIKALFWANKAVIYKPHPNNEVSDRIWEKILEPLVRYGALSFVPSSEGQALVQLGGLAAIYFTGSTNVAKAIASATDTPLVAECGGNNPCIIVPGERPWTKKELRHQARHLVTMAKNNGGAYCGRPQTIVVSRHWPQRVEFLHALRDAITYATFATGTYYAGSDTVAANFQAAHPHAEHLHPEGGTYKSGEFILLADVGVDGYALKNEAFCQLMGEVLLDVPANAEEFLPAAVEFCNRTLWGSLSCMLLVDDDTFAAHRTSIEQSIADLRYGVIAVNSSTLPSFLISSLTWGGNDEANEIASGTGHFGNVLGFDNVEKSILYDRFVSPARLLMTNKRTFERGCDYFARYMIDPTWGNVLKLLRNAIIGTMRGKDF